ncbi:gliding motility-associated ABC transporter substrate-binding protein GldG [bacterium]|nr:gliding motility-associated ABC transporter substrate-binding protein GldG [bacterium]
MVEKKTNKAQASRQKSKALGGFFIVLAVILALNVGSDTIYQRFDLTKEKRYTLSESTHRLLDKLDDNVFFTVYLDGDLPVEYNRLKTATRDMLNEFRFAAGGNFDFEFNDVLANKEIDEKRQILQQFYKQGMQIERPETKPDETPTEKYIIPSAMVYYKGKEYPLNLLKREFGRPLEEDINGSIELLEYEIGNVLRKCIAGREVKIAFVDGHGELDPIQVADVAKELSDFYSLERINININDTACTKLFAQEMSQDPEHASEILIASLIKKLKTYRGIIIAKPVYPFKEVEKFILDQYVMSGGKVIWLVESLIAEMDSVAKYGRVMTANHNHNLDDLLFHYGVKVQPTLIQDLQSNGIPAINQETNKPGFFPWLYYPLFNPADDNAITRNLESVWGRYVSSMDTTARRSLKKTVLLKSSRESRVAHNPVLISLDLLKVPVDPANFNDPGQIAAVLVEGSFRSSFAMRRGMTRNFDIPFVDSIGNNSMIVIGDGDMISNQMSADRSQIYPLGYDKYASQSFGEPVEFANKKFFLNCVDYLCDETNLIEVRSKEVVLRLLDKGKIKAERNKWQWLNMGLPILIIALFGLGNAWYRRRKWQ